ncbi:MAG: RluA family pseudouridine synthase [Acidimicrobiia bacterium]
MTPDPPSLDHEPLVVPATLAGERVDRAISLLTGWSRAEVQVLVRAGDILVGGRPVAKSRRLEAGEIVEILAGPAIPGLPVGEDVPLDVRFSDEHLLVLAKPAGLVVHPGPGHDHGTLVHGVLARYPEVAGVGEPTRPGIVHRLDRDTSGLMIVARTQDAYDALVDAFATHTVDRRYLALVSGTPGSRRGVVDAPIGRSTRRRTRMAVRDSGRPARTAYEVLETWDDPEVCLLECTLETGRTHQVRVHLSAIGHPIVGDRTYGGRVLPDAPARPFLHAHRLVFEHPLRGEPIDLEDPLPTELARLRASLGAPTGRVERPEGPDEDTAG